ncbi:MULTISPECIES: RimK/LysX family protein [unclassified Lentimonas]|uniref:ATP-dependent zinc protease family protein n=1 Tax=unclassified Lentimonas TaxID=2630993 RepID=UPI001324C11B|nr:MULTISPECIES: RimK/LysX family protein [unclassified Lentimonas]CAA6678015.1 Unannotated [Lentimonas sp. CC4]CAA6686989.1 Unannotated [Lentimonas sp. CC6]CAA7075832.1 Unannotated [Lentimonas sp. CC4]CAA7172042.1 Unannotated [Lentimonas sp. CC21]CAA7182895.1 Unannotated [Lentimonas sp. CC8]
MLKYLLLLNLTLASCVSAPKESPSTKETVAPLATQEAPTTQPKQTPQQAPDPAAEELLTIGEAERLYVHEAEYAYDARIDTGATTCSIHAEDITHIERDGEKWVKFNLVNFDTNERIKRIEKVVRVVEIKQHGSKSASRYVVMLKVQLGDDTRLFEFSLADRSNYSYPMLVGRNLLRGIAVVDVSLSYTLPKPTQQSIAKSQAK